MVALAGVGGGFHLAEQGVHLGGRKHATGADAAVAGHGAADLAEAFAEGQGCTVLGQVVGDVADEALYVCVAQQRGCFADQHGTRAEGFDDQAELGQFVGAGADALGFGGIQFDDFGRQQGLARDRALGHLSFHPLIDETFVGRVLVDDDEAVAGLGDDVGAV